MSVELHHIWYMGSADMPDDDSNLEIGGAIDKTIKLSFALQSATGVLHCRSSNSGDTTQTLTAHGRNAAGEKIDSASQLALNGLTEVNSTTQFERIMKATKSATCAGDVCIYGATTRTDTAQGGAANEITLDAGASASDNLYQFQVLIITSGTGAGQIREILSYNGTDKKCKVRDWDTTPDNTSVFLIAPGLVMEKESGFEIDEVRRIAYDASANPAGGASKSYYDKGFIYNGHATLALTNSQIDEVDLGGYEKVEFALETTLDGSGTNGVGNSRLVAPSSGIGSFNSDIKDVANSGSLSPESGQGIWFKLTLAAGTAADNTFYQVQLSGQSI